MYMSKAKVQKMVVEDYAGVSKNGVTSKKLTKQGKAYSFSKNLDDCPKDV